jgi:hypothetical protein
LGPAINDDLDCRDRWAFASRRFFANSSLAMASNVLADALAFAALACRFAWEGCNPIR